MDAKKSIDNLSYHHRVTREASRLFFRTLAENNDDYKAHWADEWEEQAKHRLGLSPTEFLAKKLDCSEARILAQASKTTGTTLVDCDTVSAAKTTHYVVDGIPMTLLTTSEFGAVTIVHCIPFLERFIDQELLKDMYEAITLHFVLAETNNLFKHLQRAYSGGRAKNRILIRAEEENGADLSRQIAVLKALGLLPKEFSENKNRDTILETLKENKPKKGSPGETEWWALSGEFPYVNLATLASNKELLEILLPNTQKTREIIPVCEYGGVLTVASKRGFKGTIRQEISSDLQKTCRIAAVIAPQGVINEIITANITSIISTTEMANQIKLDSTPDIEEIESINIQELAEGGEASIIKLVQSILVGAINKSATDIHIAAHQNETWVRYRIDGNMVESPFTLPSQFWKAIISRIKIMSGIDIKYSPIPQDGKFPMVVANAEYDIRVNTCPTIYGEKAILRIQKKSEEIPTLEKLGFYAHERSLLERAIEADHGLLIICGPTGSGKTTTLSAAIQAIDRKRWNVITAENPVEIRLPDVEQTPIDGHLMTFGKFIPAALRQDPDYIMIGETRDRETTEEVIRASITGHVVMTTLHTNSAAGAPSRLIDMGAQPFLITDALKAVCAQSLIRKLCVNCARPVRYLPDADFFIKNQIDPEWFEGLDYYLEPVGCKLCNNTGFRGRIALIEGYYTSPEVRRIILHENASTDLLKEEIVKQGGKTLYQHAMEHVVRHTTALSEALTIKNLDAV
jgi:type II secretory ATPase GspE/PulE/Tfp pilus assembly ATPase PilB-like protein